MPYFRNNDVNLLFIHIHKTGGTSLERYFSSKFNISLNEKSLYNTFLDESIKLKNNIIIQPKLHSTLQNNISYSRNNDIKLLFMNVSKYNGSSLEKYCSSKFNNKSLNNMFPHESIKLNNNTTINSSLQHMTYQTICNYKTEFDIDFNNIKIITIVRNPYERIISDLFYLSKITVNNSKEEVFDIIQTYLLSDDVDNHNIHQHVFITNDNKELIPNIELLRTETLTTDMHKLGYTDFNNHEHANTEKVDYYDYLNNDSIKLINDFYDDDFRLFNYTKKTVF